MGDFNKINPEREFNLFNNEIEGNENNSVKDIFSCLDVKEMYKLLSRKKNKSEYIEKVSVKDQLKTVSGEVNELSAEIGIKDNNVKIRQELSDVLYTLGLSIITMIENGDLTKEDLKEMIGEHAEKIYSRCPSLLKTKIPLEEERRVWRELKKWKGWNDEQKEKKIKLDDFIND